MSFETWLIYLLASIGLSLSPGPNGLLALTNGVLHGRERTMFTIVGGATGFVAVMALSTLGIGALLQSSAHAITVLKWVGGAYLVWLGIQVWRSPPIALDARAATASASGAALFRQGALTAMTNPKALLFFAAFLPQFIDPERSLLLQFAIMSGTFAALEIVTEFVIASFAQRVSPWLARVGRRFNRACGGIFMAIGVALPLRG